MKTDKIIAFIRPSDYEHFTLNEDGETYSLEMLKKDFPNHLHHKYSKETLQYYEFIEVYEQEFL